MRKYHHLGIPTTVPRTGKYYLAPFSKMQIEFPRIWTILLNSW